MTAQDMMRRINRERVALPCWSPYGDRAIRKQWCRKPQPERE